MNIQCSVFSDSRSLSLSYPTFKIVSRICIPKIHNGIILNMDKESVTLLKISLLRKNHYY